MGPDKQAGSNGDKTLPAPDAFPVYPTFDDDVRPPPLLDLPMSITFLNDGGNGVFSSRAPVTLFDVFTEGGTNLSIQNLLSSEKWGYGIGSGLALTASFPAATSSYLNSASFTSFSPAQISAAIGAMNAYAAVSGLSFTVTSDSATNAGDIRWGQSLDRSVGTAFANLPSSYADGGDIWLGPNSPESYSNPVPGGYGYQTFLHELGHALGLLHPHDSSIAGKVAEDNLKYSVMSYRDFAGDALDGLDSSYFPTSPMLNDIAAVQFLYGTNATFHAGNDSYRWNASSCVFETIWDAGGVDTIDASNQAMMVSINLNPGAWSQIGQQIWNGNAWVRDCLTIAYGTQIENATGSAFDDTLNGNGLANVLFGLGGNDVLVGGSGNDVLSGGAGNDNISGGAGFDTAGFSGTRANYTIMRSATGIMVTGGNDGRDFLTSIERLSFTDRSINLKAAASDFNGDGGSDLLWRNAGNGGNVIWRGADNAQGQVVAPVADLNWKIAGVGDFNGDGTSDLLWRNSLDGSNIIWRGGDSNQGQAVTPIGDSWKLAGVGDFNDDEVSDILWRNSASGANIIWRGGDSGQGQAVASMADLNWKVAGVGDFNGDGTSDLLWRNAVSGANVIWKSGDNAQGQVVTTMAAPSWKVAGVGDFNGDGTSDILWRNAVSGANAIWRGGDSGQVQAVTAVADVNWKVAGAGDYNGDGTSDILWRHATTGANIIWRAADSSQGQAVAMADSSWSVQAQTNTWQTAPANTGNPDVLWRNSATGANIIWKGADANQGQGVAAVGDVQWKMVARADFNGDGAQDILWRNAATGQNTLWRASDSNQVQGVTPVSDLSWKIAGVGDFNDDGSADILWRNASSGANTIWRRGDSSQGQGVTPVGDTSWKIAGVGDFNGDGASDILWRNSTSGANTIWRGGDSNQVQGVTQVGDQTWKIAGVGDFNGDGSSDILWRNSASGANTIWKGGASGQVQAVTQVGDSSWKIVGTGDYNSDGVSDVLWRNAATGIDTIWTSADSAQIQAVAQVTDVNWSIEHQTSSWLNADGTYGV